MFWHPSVNMGNTSKEFGEPTVHMFYMIHLSFILALPSSMVNGGSPVLPMIAVMFKMLIKWAFDIRLINMWSGRNNTEKGE